MGNKLKPHNIIRILLLFSACKQVSLNVSFCNHARYICFILSTAFYYVIFGPGTWCITLHFNYVHFCEAADFLLTFDYPPLKQPFCTICIVLGRYLCLKSTLLMAKNVIRVLKWRGFWFFQILSCFLVKMNEHIGSAASLELSYCYD